MRVRTTRGSVVDLDNLPFEAWLYYMLVKLQYHFPSLRLEGVEVRTNKKVRVALQELDLDDWRGVNMLNLP
jgi:hypothetical protein